MHTVVDFIKKVFKVDGKVETMPVQEYSFNGACVKVTDKERGTFYVAIIPENHLKNKKSN